MWQIIPRRKLPDRVKSFHLSCEGKWLSIAIFYQGVLGFSADQMKLCPPPHSHPTPCGQTLRMVVLVEPLFVCFCLFWLLFVECEMLKEQIAHGPFVPRSPGHRTRAITEGTFWPLHHCLDGGYPRVLTVKTRALGDGWVFKIATVLLLTRFPQILHNNYMC